MKRLAILLLERALGHQRADTILGDLAEDLGDGRSGGCENSRVRKGPRSGLNASIDRAIADHAVRMDSMEGTGLHLIN